MAPPVTIAVLGLGEAGGAIAPDLVAAGVRVRGYDPTVRAHEVGVDEAISYAVSEADAVGGADVVLSLNSGQDAVSALTNALPGLAPGTLWADLNTAPAATKQTLVRTVNAAGLHVDVVDVAVTAAVPGRGLRTPMLVAGPAASQFADLLNALGGCVTVQPGPVGAAASRKLLRSVFYKGLAAAVAEALAAADAAGCRDWLWADISAELAGFDDTSLDRLVDGTRRHARRRAEEMTAAAAQLVELGLDPHMATATRNVLTVLRDRQEIPA